jgi:hypothetical protein
LVDEFAARAVPKNERLLSLIRDGPMRLSLFKYQFSKSRPFPLICTPFAYRLVACARILSSEAALAFASIVKARAAKYGLKVAETGANFQHVSFHSFDGKRGEFRDVHASHSAQVRFVKAANPSSERDRTAPSMTIL